MSKSREADILNGRITDTMTFNEKVWAMTCRIPKGRVSTYGEIARALGTQAYRAVGNALNKNPYAPGVPCHRVVASDGGLGGFGGGLPKKRKLLAEEGVKLERDRVDVKKLFEFKPSLKRI